MNVAKDMVRINENFRKRKVQIIVIMDRTDERYASGHLSDKIIRE